MWKPSDHLFELVENDSYLTELSFKLFAGTYFVNI